MRFLKWALAVFVVLVVIYYSGPRAKAPQLSKSLPELPDNLEKLDQYVINKENDPTIKRDNQARIIWYDSAYQKTPYSIVYLHGFSASQEEGDPLHLLMAKRYGCNLYLSRLYGHGKTEEETMLDVTATKMLESAKEAIAIGERIGDNVIIMATSTGGTLALYLAEDPKISGLILYSPNIELFDPNSSILTMHWGLQAARLIVGSDYIEWTPTDERKNYWTSRYRIEAAVQLKVLINSTMTEETFKKVKKPVFVGYYYKNDIQQDSTVSVPAILSMYDQLGTPAGFKRKIAFPNVGHHVMACRLTSKDLPSVEKETIDFLESVMKLKPVNNPLADSLQSGSTLRGVVN